MATLLEDPRIRQTWNQISQNAESATENAAASIWSVQHNYIYPCFSSTISALGQCTASCFSDRDERARRLRDRGRTRGRAESNFDFYDDWNEDEGVGGSGLLGGWGNDELDRLLAGSGSHRGSGDGTAQAPRRKRGMSYGTRGSKPTRKSLEPDPTIIPSTSALGFLGRLPFKIGGTLRYKPSAADLQEHPGALRDEHLEEEGEPLISENLSDDEGNVAKGHSRQRSSTTSSGETSDSFRSRGDLFPSDGEDDAVPLPDEFAMVLETRAANASTDDRSSGKTRSSKGKRPANSRKASRNISRAVASSQSLPSLAGFRSSSEASLLEVVGGLSPDAVFTPSLTDLQQEEDRIRLEEDEEVERKRQAAAKLALERGLHVEESIDNFSEDKDPADVVETPPVAADMILKHVPEAHEVPATSKTQHTTNIKDPSKENLKHEFIPARLPNFG